MSQNLLDNGDFSQFSGQDRPLAWSSFGWAKVILSKEKCDGKNAVETTDRPHAYSGIGTEIQYNVTLGKLNIE